jgi:site-specific DNA-methyltransferase (adenine-specific)
MQPYYEKNGITIYHGDCREVLPQLEHSSVDLVVTDPPYFLPAAHHASRSGTSRSSGNLSILEHFFKDTLADIKRVMQSQAFAYIFCDGQSYPIFHRAGYSMFKSLRPLIWDKGTSINGYSWRHQHELIMFCQQNESPNTPTGDGDVLKCPSVPMKQRVHDAEKPVALLERFVSKHGNRPGGDDPGRAVVLDPFCGSGSTLVAALNQGRSAVGVEIEEYNCEIAARRLEQATLNLAEAV